MKKLIALLICIVALVCAGVLCSVSGYAQTDVVFCDAKGKIQIREPRQHPSRRLRRHTRSSPRAVLSC